MSRFVCSCQRLNHTSIERHKDYRRSKVCDFLGPQRLGPFSTHRVDLFQKSDSSAEKRNVATPLLNLLDHIEHSISRGPEKHSQVLLHAALKCNGRLPRGPARCGPKSRAAIFSFPAPCSPLPAPRSLLPAPRSLLPAPSPRSLLPAPRSPLPAPCSPLPAPAPRSLPAPCSPLPAPCSPLPAHMLPMGGFLPGLAQNQFFFGFLGHFILRIVDIFLITRLVSLFRTLEESRENRGITPLGVAYLQTGRRARNRHEIGSRGPNSAAVRKPSDRNMHGRKMKIKIHCFRSSYNQYPPCSCME